MFVYLIRFKHKRITQRRENQSRLKTSKLVLFRKKPFIYNMRDIYVIIESLLLPDLVWICFGLILYSAAIHLAVKCWSMPFDNGRQFVLMSGNDSPFGLGSLVEA